MMWMITKDQLERMIEIRQYVDIALLAQKTLLIEEFLKTMRRMKNILEYCKNHPDVYSEFDAVGDLWNVYKEEYGKWEQRKTK